MPARENAMPSPKALRRHRLPLSLANGLLCTVLAISCLGCSTMQPKQIRVGQSQAEVLSAMGQPTGRYALDGGVQRLEFARGPAGRVTWMVDLDAHGRVLGIEQVLDAAHFARVVDKMPREALLRLLGRPAARQGESQGRETWSWRYETNDCLWFRVTLSADGLVRDGGAVMTDPACDTRSASLGR